MKVFPCWLGFFLALAYLSDVSAQQTATLTNIYNFGNGGAETPNTLILGRDGNFYGTTADGGVGNSYLGTVFRLTPEGALNIVYSFTGGADGGIPVPGLIQASDGNLYGVTTQNGASGNGTVYQVTTAGGFKVLCSLGARAANGVAEGADGNFYGETQQSQVYQVTPAGAFKILAFDQANATGGLVRGSDGNFYGTDSNSGSGPTGAGRSSKSRRPVC